MASRHVGTATALPLVGALVWLSPALAPPQAPALAPAPPGGAGRAAGPFTPAPVATSPGHARAEPSPGPAAAPVTGNPAGTAAPAPWQRWRWPLETRPGVIRRFLAPRTPYGPGHRGVDLAAPPQAVVVAPRDGRVIFAGPVAGRQVLVIAHPGGWRTSVEPVVPTVAVGTQVRAGQPVATVDAEFGHCPVSCLHWGVRLFDDYLDPLPLVVGGHVVLLPVGN